MYNMENWAKSVHLTAIASIVHIKQIFWQTKYNVFITWLQLNHEWAELREKAEAKREELNSAHGVQTFHIECRETISWIEDKKRILQSTDSLEMDLTGIMTLQVRPSVILPVDD